MSTYSHNYHIHLPQNQVLALLDMYFVVEGFLNSHVHDIVPTDPVATDAVHTERFDTTDVRYVVSPTDADNWTMMWSEWDDGDEHLVAFLAYHGDCTALYGHDNDQTDNKRWILFQGATHVAEVWDVGRVYAEGAAADGVLPLDLYAAFAALGRTYDHRSFRGVLYETYANYRSGQPISKLVIAQRPPT